MRMDPVDGKGLQWPGLTSARLGMCGDSAMAGASPGCALSRDPFLGHLALGSQALLMLWHWQTGEGREVVVMPNMVKASSMA